MSPVFTRRGWARSRGAGRVRRTAEPKSGAARSTPRRSLGPCTWGSPARGHRRARSERWSPRRPLPRGEAATLPTTPSVRSAESRLRGLHSSEADHDQVQPAEASLDIDEAERWVILPVTKNGDTRGVPLTGQVLAALRALPRDDGCGRGTRVPRATPSESPAAVRHARDGPSRCRVGHSPSSRQTQSSLESPQAARCPFDQQKDDDERQPDA